MCFLPKSDFLNRGVCVIDEYLGFYTVYTYASAYVIIDHSMKPDGGNFGIKFPKIQSHLYTVRF